MCECIEKVNSAIREQYGDPEASIHTGFSLGQNTLTQRPSGMSAQYRRKKKNGEYEERKQTIYLTPTFCPFCGKEYQPQKPKDNPSGVF